MNKHTNNNNTIFNNFSMTTAFYILSANHVFFTDSFLIFQLSFENSLCLRTQLCRSLYWHKGQKVPSIHPQKTFPRVADLTFQSWTAEGKQTAWDLKNLYSDNKSVALKMAWNHLGLLEHASGKPIHKAEREVIKKLAYRKRNLQLS